jgi:hypothetical protein
MKALVKILVVIMVLSVPTGVFAIGIGFNATSGGVLEDTVLWATMAGDPPRYAVALGDFDLSTVTSAVVDIPVGDGTSTHWWLIGHRGGDIIYSSTQNLAGVDIMGVEPFDIGDAFTIPTTIASLASFNSGGPVSLDIWAMLANGHTSHVTADGNFSDLWLFSSPGSSIGQVGISINNNIPPVIPVPTTVLLLGSGLLSLAGWRRFRKN